MGGSVPPRRPAFSSTFREAVDAAAPEAVTGPPRWYPLKGEGPDPDAVAADALAEASARAAAAHVERPPAPPPAPRRRVEMASVLSVAGRTLIALGLLVLGFVGFELVGTNLAEARSQSTLMGQLTAPPPPVDLPVSKPLPGPAPPPPPVGSAVAQIRIPRIGVDKAVVEGVELSDLRKGPGHYKGTPLPGQPGNAAIAGHRTTYGAPFFRLDEMQPGDTIFVSTAQGAFRYEVRQTVVVKPTQTDIIAPTAGNQLTLTTCEPRFSAAKRLVVIADLKGPAAAGAQLTESPNPAVAAGVAAVPLAIDEVVGASGDPAERVPSILWGIVVAALGIAAAILGRLWRRWPSYLLVALPFLAALWTFYSHLAKAVPS